MDLIDREEVIEALDVLCDRVCQYSKEQRAVMCGACPLGSAFDVIEEFPSAEKTGKWFDEVRHGRWIYRQLPMPLSDGSKECVECSVCHTHWDGEMNYCPNCGARMEN